MHKLHFPHITNSYTPRPYQKEALRATIDHTRSLIQGTLDRTGEDALFPTAALLEMATGSGKTYTQWFSLPTSLDWPIGILGGDPAISLTKEYIIALFEGREFRKE